MKYAITGHTSGIGLAIFNKLQPDILGFSRSNGYDITKPNDRFRIVDQVADCDVFINNAYNSFCQTELFIEWFKRYHWTNKTVINIGSDITEHKLPIARFDLLNYQACKLSLKEISFKLQSNCTVKYKTFGYVGTEGILKKYPAFTEKDFLSVNSAVEIILS